MSSIDENEPYKIAIMGGTFDPIHYGHLVTAESVRYQFKIDKVIFIPTGKPAHKQGKLVTDGEHRFNMTKLAIESNAFFEVSDIEINRSGVTYTVDTIKELKKYYGDDVDMYFITGADGIFEIMSWKDIEELFQICSFIAVTRPNYDTVELVSCIAKLQEQFNANIFYTEVPALAISSSQIRGKHEHHQPIKYLIPEVVEDYINEHKLYRNNSLQGGKILKEKALIVKDLKEKLSEKRYSHTLSVAKTAVELAKQYQVDTEKVELAALLHDCAKNYSTESLINYIKEFGLDIQSPESYVPVLHAFVGAEIARELYGVEDEEVLNAVRYHTTARPNMSNIEKIIFIADYIEPNRRAFEGLEQVRELVEKDLDEALLKALSNTINFLESKHRNVYSLTRAAHRYYNEVKLNEQ